MRKIGPDPNRFLCLQIRSGKLCTINCQLFCKTPKTLQRLQSEVQHNFFFLNWMRSTNGAIQCRFYFISPSLLKLRSSHHVVTTTGFWNSYFFKGDRNNFSMCINKAWIDKRCKTCSFTFTCTCKMFIQEKNREKKNALLSEQSEISELKWKLLLISPLYLSYKRFQIILNKFSSSTCSEISSFTSERWSSLHRT